MIEVGEYVRSKIGSIGKVTKIEENKFLYENKTLITWAGNVVKHSKNIIDLIEVGDYVNGYKVIAKSDDEYIEILTDDIEQGELLTQEDIETILTKEQYMQNCYTVERKKECGR